MKIHKLIILSFVLLLIAFFGYLLFREDNEPDDIQIKNQITTDSDIVKSDSSTIFEINLSDSSALIEGESNDLIKSPKESPKETGWIDPRGLFPIFAFNFPEHSKNHINALRVIERGGINILINGSFGLMPEPYALKAAFEKLGDSNLKWLTILANDCKDNFIYNNSNDAINKDISKFIKEFYNPKYTYGWYLWDEPGPNKKICPASDAIKNNDFEDINRMSRQIRRDSIQSSKLDYMNLMPSYWSGTPNIQSYEKYIDAYFTSQEFKPRVLSIDHYPFVVETYGGFRKDYYSNLEILRRKSQQYYVPFWMIVLSSGHLSYKNPSFEEISFQVYSALAYGAKGIGYYLYSKSWEKNGYTSWILEGYVDDPNVADSLHGPLFVPVQYLNKQIQVLGKILSELSSIDVIHTSDYPNKQKDITQSLFKLNASNNFIKEIYNNENINADHKILIGVFEDKNNSVPGGKYLLIVNKDVSVNSEHIIKLNVQYKLFKFNKETGEKYFIANTDNISATISPGSGE
ncbi:MAG: hypothetical protein KKH32_04850, partial [Bacteroidetes bacterium]|nr:hypothetical protein [Bacteroidota bacterium]